MEMDRVEKSRERKCYGRQRKYKICIIDIFEGNKNNGTQKIFKGKI